MKLYLLASLLLAGCSTLVAPAVNKLEAFTLADANNALAIAQKANDQPAITCYTTIKNALTNLQVPSTGNGILTTNELARITAAQQVQVNAACVGLL